MGKVSISAFAGAIFLWFSAGPNPNPQLTAAGRRLETLDGFSAGPRFKPVCSTLHPSLVLKGSAMWPHCSLRHHLQARRLSHRLLHKLHQPVPYC